MAVGAIAIDLRGEASKAASLLGVMPDLSAAERAAAIATWRGRMVNETISARVFAVLLQQALDAGLDGTWLRRIGDAIGDELRHGRSCAAVVVALGGEALAEVASLAPVPRHEDAGPVEALLRNALSIGCLSETVAVALIGAERLRAGPPALERTLSAILADEVQHAKLGWDLLEALLPRLDAEAQRRLGDYLEVAMRHLVAHELAHLPHGPAPTAAAQDVGVCDGAEARALFFDTVSEVIVPRLEQLGLPARACWARCRDASPWDASQLPS
jgi:hypothetical protein